MKFIIGTGVVFGLAMFAIFASANARGINMIGENAVYLAGEACTVNMTFDRTEEEIIQDMMDCMILHREAKAQ